MPHRTSNRPLPATADRTQAAPALDPAALQQALHELLEPLAQLAVARGVPFATVSELLETAFVNAASAAHPSLPRHRRVSRISTTTGINRREVSRIMQAQGAPPPVVHSPATRIFTKWLTEPVLKTPDGEVMPLPRQGPAPSFETLARSITRDVHPRSLLDELCRLGLAHIEGDTVHVLRDSFVPRSDTARMLGFLGSNVGDHLRAAVENVLAETPPHLEQAVFADTLSDKSLEAFAELIRTQWKLLLQATVPVLQQLIDADRAAGRTQDQRVRVGLYTYHAPMVAPDESPAVDDAPQPKPAAKR